MLYSLGKYDLNVQNIGNVVEMVLCCTYRRMSGYFDLIDGLYNICGIFDFIRRDEYNAFHIQ